MEIATKVFALGNSNAIRIPRLLMEAMSLKAGDSVTIEVIGNSEMVVRKSNGGSSYPSIREMFDGYEGEYKPVEMDADDMVGRELI